MIGTFLLGAVPYLGLGIFCYLILQIGIHLAMQGRKLKRSWFTMGVEIVFVFYMVIIFSATISPTYGFRWEPDWKSANFIPFRVMIGMFFGAISGEENSFVNLFGNIAMFVPFGLALPVISNYYQNARRTILAGTALSVLIEFCQLFLSRGTDIDDVMLNTIGTAAGFLCFKIAVTVLPGIKKSLGSRVLKRGKYVPQKKDGLRPVLVIMVMMLSVIGTGSFKMYQYKNDIPAEDARQLKSGLDSQSADTKDWKQSAQISTDGLALEGKYIYFGEVGSDKPLYEKDSRSRIAPASTAKILTSMVVADHCKMNEKVTVGNEINSIGPDSSIAGLQAGDQATVDMLLNALLLPSGNDAAYTLAVYTGKKILKEEKKNSGNANEAIERFVKEMNKKAKSIGAVHSNFARPDGYDSDLQYTTAEDMAYIASYFVDDYSRLNEIVEQKSARVLFLNGKDVTYQNSNELLQPGSHYYDENVLGLKTGSSEAAGKCLIALAEIKGKKYLAVVMNSTEGGRYQDCLSLFGLKEK